MRPSIRQFFAALTILSLTFTQVLPAWALRPGSGVDAPDGGVRTGLEEALRPDLRSVGPQGALQVLSPDGRNLRILHAAPGSVERGDCGCFARVGMTQAQGGLSSNAVVVRAAEALEPRGYQSASVGVITHGGTQSEFHVRKVLGAVTELKNVLGGHPLPDGSVQLVHLRWPTQGEASEDNQHPTILREGDHAPSEVELVFNGDITNFRETDAFLAEKGIVRPANVATDAWTIGALIWFYFRQPSEAQIAERARQIYEQSGHVDGRDSQNWAEAVTKLGDERVHMSLLEAVSLAYGRLEGDFALIAASELEPDRVIGALKGQKPLIVGRGRTPEVGNFIGSEATTFIDHTNRNQSVKSGDIVEVTGTDVRFFRRKEVKPGRFDLVPVPGNERPVVELDVEEIKVGKEHLGTTYPSFTEKEIAEQPEALDRTLNYQDRVEVVSRRIEGYAEPMPGLNLSDADWRNARGALLLAMGTATHACEASARFMERRMSAPGVPFKIEVATGTTLFDDLRGEILHRVRQVDPGAKIPGDLDGWVDLIRRHRDGVLRVMVDRYAQIIGIAVSQSGNTMDTNQTVILLQALGMRFIGVVNKPIETPLIRLTKDDGGLMRTKSGTEVGVASTKAYTSQVPVLTILSIYGGLVRGTLSPDVARRDMDELLALPDKIRQYLRDSRNLEAIRRVAQALRGQQVLMFLARGPQVAVAKEGALKMLELAYLFTFGMDMALMKHGFIAVFPESRDTHVTRYAVALLTDRASLPEALVNISEIRARYGQVVAICYESDVENVRRAGADVVLPIPDVSDDLAPVVSVLPLQILAAETTKSINEVGEELGSMAEQLYVMIRQREMGIGNITDAQLQALLERIQARYGNLTANGELELLPTSKIREVRLLIGTAISHGKGKRIQRMEETCRQIIRALRGPRLSLIMFFDHELARTDLAANAGEGMTKTEREAVRAIFANHPLTLGQNPSELLAKLEVDMAVFYSQMVSRGSTLKGRWKNARADKGLGEFLGRNLDKPRGLAKEVTVDLLAVRLRQQLGELGLSADTIEACFQGTLQLVDGAIVEVPGVIDLISRITDVPADVVRRRAAMHEQAHFILRLIPDLAGLLSQLEQSVDAADPEFRSRFEEVFGEFDSDIGLWEEVLAKYISARLTGEGMEIFGSAAALDKMLGNTALQWTNGFRESLAGTGLGTSVDELGQPGMLPGTLRDLFDPAFLPAYGGRRSGRDREAAKAEQLDQFTRALGLDPEIRQAQVADMHAEDIKTTLDQLHRAAMAEAPLAAHETTGLEEGSADPEFFAVNHTQVSSEVRYGLSQNYGAPETGNDWATMRPVETALKSASVGMEIRFSEFAPGITWKIPQPGSSATRRFFEIASPGAALLRITPAYTIRTEGPQRVLFIRRTPKTGSPSRYWVIPVDDQMPKNLLRLVDLHMKDKIGVPVSVDRIGWEFKPAPLSPADHTLFTVTAPPNTGGVAVQVMNPLWDALRISVDVEVIDRPGVSYTLITAPITVADLNAPRPPGQFGGVTLLQEIGLRLAARQAELEAERVAAAGPATPTPTALAAAPGATVSPAVADPFRSQAEAALHSLLRESDNTPIAGPEIPIFDGVMEAFDTYRATGKPQVRVFDHPSGAADRCLLAAIHVDHPGMEMTVIGPIGERGGNIRTTEGRKIESGTEDPDVSLIFLDIDMSAEDVREGTSEEEEPVTEKILRALRGAFAPPDFTVFLQPHQNQMPEVSFPITSVYGAILDIWDGGPSIALASNNVPDRKTQAALSMIVPAEGTDDLEARVRAVLQREEIGLTIVNDTGGAEMWFNGVYREEGREPVRVLRCVVDAAYNAEPVMKALSVLEGMINGNATPPTSTETGLEELAEGTDYGVDGDGNMMVLRSLEIRKAVLLRNGISLNPQGGVITIAEGAVIFKGSTLKGPPAGSPANIVIGRAEVGGILVGSADKPLVIAYGVKVHRVDADVKYSVIGPNTVIDGADVSDATVVPFVRGGRAENAKIDNNTTVERSVVFGGSVGTGVKLYEDGVVGPFVRMENNSEHSGSFLWGVVKKAGINFLHHGFTETFWALSAIWQGKPMSDEYYENLRETLRTVLYGAPDQAALGEPAPISDSGALWNLTFGQGEQARQVQAQRVNFGANTVTSDYNSITGARASGSASGGVSTGVNAVLKLPALLDERVLIANLAQASGEVAPGTIVLGADQPGKAEGWRSLGKGYALTGEVDQEVDVQTDYFQKLLISAEVFAEGARRATDPYTLAGYAATIRAIQAQFEGIAPRYAKTLTDALPVSIETTTRRRELTAAYLAQLQGNGTKAPSSAIAKQQGTLVKSVEDEIRTLDSRLQKQRDLQARQGDITKEWDAIGAGIRAAADSVAAVTQPAVAEWARAWVLDPTASWTNPLAGLEEAIPLPAGATQQKVVFLTPEILTPAFLNGLARLKPAEGEQMRLVVFGENSFQLSQVEPALEAAGLKPIEVVNVQEQYGGVLAEAVVDKQMVYFTQGLDIQVVYNLSDLAALGRFLQIPDASFRTWQEQITGASLGVQA